MTATEDLRNEHEGIRLMLRILAAVAEKVKKGASVPAGDLEAMADFLSGLPTGATMAKRRITSSRAWRQPACCGRAAPSA